MTHLFLWPLSYVFVACWHFHDNTSWKVTEKTPNLEDPYIEFCNSIWPHLYTVGNIFLLAKHFQKTPKSENAQKCPKMSFLSIRELLSMIATYDTRVVSYTYVGSACIFMAMICIWTCMSQRLVFVWHLSLFQVPSFEPFDLGFSTLSILN